jgi:hypothetical protein
MKGGDKLPAFRLGVIVHGGAQTLCERAYSIAALRNAAILFLATRFRSAPRHVTN